MHQCHIVCWVGQPAFEGTLFIIGARFLLKNPSTVLIALPGSFFNLAFANDAGQLDALVVSVQGKRARRKHFSMTRSQMMAQILHEGECSHFHQDAKFASHQIGMWLFCTIGPAGDPWSSSFQLFFFFFLNRTKAAAPSSSWICRRGMRTKWVVLRRGMCREL